ncbi:hypothetical protein BJV74DRAFT_799621 [Russula compacta]|nr:hypothetical protein BJV74DRAFT_799621 [Russula compacta]
MSRHPLTHTYAVADLSQGQPPMPESCPQPKKRGRPPKATTTTVSSTIASDKDKQEPSAGNGDSSGDEEQPPAKKPKASDNKGAMSSMPLGKQGKATVPPCNRVVNPGAPDKKNKRHTSAQVAADKKQKEELQHDLDALTQRQIEILAEMEAKQEMADEAEDQDAIRTLADIDEIEGDVEMLDAISEFSKFGGDTDVDREAGKEIVAPKVPVKAVCHEEAESNAQRKKKAGKAKEAIVKGKKKDLEKTSAPKKGKLTFPSGMVAGWKPKGPEQILV